MPSGTTRTPIGNFGKAAARWGVNPSSGDATRQVAQLGKPRNDRRLNAKWHDTHANWQFRATLLACLSR
jgi:hypothetical protein